MQMSRGVTIYQYVSVSGYQFRLLNDDTYLTFIIILANLQFVSFDEDPVLLSYNRQDSH